MCVVWPGADTWHRRRWPFITSYMLQVMHFTDTRQPRGNTQLPLLCLHDYRWKLMFVLLRMNQSAWAGRGRRGAQGQPHSTPQRAR